MMRFQINKVNFEATYDGSQKVYEMRFQTILATFIFDLRIDLIDLKPHNVKFPFLETSYTA